MWAHARQHDAQMRAKFKFPANSFNIWFDSYHSHDHEYGSLGIAPIRNCTHFLKIEFVVAGAGRVFIFSYYIHQGNKSDKDRKIVSKNVFCMKKDLIHFLKDGCNSVWVQFHVYRSWVLIFCIFRLIGRKLIFVIFDIVTCVNYC